MEAVISIIITIRKVAVIAAKVAAVIDTIQRKETVVAGAEVEVAIDSISTDTIIIITRDLVAIVAKAEAVVKALKSTDRIKSIKQFSNLHVRPIKKPAMLMNRRVKLTKKFVRPIKKPVWPSSNIVKLIKRPVKLGSKLV